MRPFVERLPLIHAARGVLRERHLLIEAAAGYGKSVLLRQLTAHIPQSSYLPLSAEDDDDAVLRRRLAAADGDVLLLDDVHRLTAGSPAAVCLHSELENGKRRLVLAGRYLPFATLSLTGAGVAVRWGDAELAFSADTAAPLLGADAPRLVAELNGWPLGIDLFQRLAPAQRRVDVARDRLFDYLAAAVYDQLPPATRRFLRLTAVPETFTPALAAHLLDASIETARGALRRIVEQNLFIDRADPPDAYRYHDLFRAFLKARNPAAENAALTRRAAAWLVEHEQPVAATDHYLAAGAADDALQVMAAHRTALLIEQGRFLTYRRWLQGIEPALLPRYPDLVLDYVGRIQYENRYYDEAVALLAHLVAVDDLDTETQHKVAVQQANLHRVNNEHDAAIAILQPLIDSGALPDDRAFVACQIAAICSAEQLRPRQSHRYFVQASEAARTLTEGRQRNVRVNMAQTALAALGRFEGSLRIIDVTLDSEPNAYWQLRYLLQGSIIAFRCGEVARLRHYLARIDQVAAQVEQIVSSDQRWMAHYRVLLAALRDPGRAPAYRGEDIWEMNSPSSRVWGASLALAVARLANDPTLLAQAIPTAREVAHSVIPHAFERAAMALEADIAAGLAYLEEGAGGADSFTLSSMTRRLVAARCQGEWPRLHALLALVCHKNGQPRWRRHARRAVRLHRQPQYSRLLTRRDPFLGAAFWTLLLREGVAVPTARAALIEIGIIGPILPLLEAAAPPVSAEAAAILAAIGDEAALPVVQQAARRENHAATKQALAGALDTLEAAAPPPLHITLMGPCRVVRGRDVLTDFHRPIVLRLLQYFALNRGRPLARDRILDDLWPDAPRDKAATSFRTVYSRLRHVLEPMMRRNGPNRYVALEGDSYTFDPLGRVTTDVERFEATLAAALAAEAPLDDAVRQLLAAYAPLLPELPYADWLLERRERLHELYINGGLRLGQELLARDEPVAAQQWAQRIIDTAPWLEAAYQLLMRAYARQNLRSRALRTYAEAQDALRRELAVEPSPLTTWLYRRLQAGEAI